MKLNKKFLKEFSNTSPSREVSQCLELCLEENPPSILDAVSLIRFSKSLDRFSKASSEPYVRNPLSDHEFYLESLQEKVRSSGVYYFGPMFQIDERSAGLVRTRGDVLRALRAGGFSLTVLEPMGDELLDMYFSHLLETGLVSNISR